MKTTKIESNLSREIQEFTKRSFSPNFDQLKENFRTDPVWRRFREIGSELWLDTGSIEDSQQLWTQEFLALTTNNTLLNREVQTGRYDSLISKAAQILKKYQLSEHEQILEIAFILNAWHALRLVEKFDAYVSVEEHTEFAHKTRQAVDCARRYYNICPERFIIKIPFTPAGLLATRQLSAEGIPINQTLGFSARQNYLIARIGQPAYLNVFLGRLNSFVADNKFGDGAYMGEKATLASQTAIRKLRQANLTVSRQIGASFRAGKQLQDLAGIDVMTIPPKVASEFLSMGLVPDKISDRTTINYSPELNEGVDPNMIRLDTLWNVNDELVACVEALEKENLDSFTPNDLINFFKDHGHQDLMVCWSKSEIATSKAEGKIPQFKNWQGAFSDKSIGLDSLMNLAGLNSFASDQKATDERIRNVLIKGDKK